VKLSFKNTYNNKRVLITGATGFKGSWLSIWLHSLGSDVLGFSLEPITERDNYVVCGLENKINHIAANIENFKKLCDVINNFKPHFIFHLAAQPLVINSYKDPISTYNTNVNGTLNILEAIRKTDFVSVGIIVTSDKCYEINNSKVSYKETDPLGGIDPYSASKAVCEIITNSYIKSYFSIKGSPNIASVRAGNVIGGGDWAENRIVPDCIKSIENGKPIMLRNPQATRPWQHVLEPLSGYLTLGKVLYEKGKKYQSAWNFGPKLNDSKSVEDVAKAIIKYLGNGNISYENFEEEYKESILLAIDIQKSKKFLDWNPKLSFDEAIKLTVDEYNIKSLTTDQIYRQRLEHILYYCGK
jgi:CDP-glucose 4,6-dehydratase